MLSSALRLEPHPAVVAALPPSRETILRLNRQSFLADPSGSLFWAAERLLVVADLHLEKGSSYAARRVFLPPYDTSATLARLAEAVTRLAPRRIVALGDSFHDDGGAGRLMAHDVQALRAMQTGRDWIWIAGNHDPAPPGHLQGDHVRELSIGAIRFRHEPSVSPGDGEIAGHLHPAAVVGGRGAAVRRRCFLADARRCILPAFGAYAGGLNIRDDAFRHLFATDDSHAQVKAHVLGRGAVYTVGRRQCLADSTGSLGWRRRPG